MSYIVHIAGLNVTKADIMEFLDMYKGIYFKVDDIKQQMGDDYNKINVQSVYTALRGIVKREEYECHVYNNKTGHKIKLYRRR